MRSKVRRQTRDSRENLINIHRKWGIFLPKKVNDSLSDFLNMFADIVCDEEDPGRLLQEAFNDIILVIQKNIGTEPLSQETLDVIT